MANIFDYKIIKGDPTIQRVKEKEFFYSYAQINPNKYDSTYVDLLNAINAHKDIWTNGQLHASKVDTNYIKNSIAIWKELGICLHDIDILNESYDITKYQGIITQEFLDAIESVHPVKLPIKFKIFNPREHAKVEFFELDCEDPENNAILFQRIILDLLNNQITSCFYAHEIAHTQQLYSIGNGTSIVQNDETIPMLMEQLAAYKMDASGNALTTIRNNRLIHLAQTLSDLSQIKNIALISKIEFDTYIQSTIQSIALANTYLFGSVNIQQEIIEWINKIFEGNLSVEDLLEKFDANLENVSKDINYLKRTK